MDKPLQVTINLDTMTGTPKFEEIKEELIKPYTRACLKRDLRENDKHLIWIDTKKERGIEIEDPTGYKRLYPLRENTVENWKMLAYQLVGKTWVTPNHMYKLMCIALEQMERKNNERLDDNYFSSRLSSDLLNFLQIK